MSSVALPTDTAPARAFLPPPRRPALLALPGGLATEPPHPLQLGRRMRQRLTAAVRALLVPGLSDAAQLLRVVVAAKARHADACLTITRVPELARWLGVGCSTVDKALAELRRAGALETAERRIQGAVVGLDCRVPGLSATSAQGKDPLALTRTELATLLRLVEQLFAPGWVHRDGSQTPAGLLGERTGRGAPTDRLALLLLVLDARANGKVRLCGGAVDTRIGRPAATAARLLGATAHQGARILARLQRAGALVLERRPTASGLAGRGEIRIPAVAAAHRTGTDPARPRTRIPERAAAAVGDRPAASPAKPQATPVRAPKEAGTPERDAAADLHAHHAQVVAVEEVGAAEFGGSGEAESGVPADAGGAHGRATTAPSTSTVEPDPGPGALRAENTTPEADGSRTTGVERPDAGAVALRRRQRIALRPVNILVAALTPGQRAVALRAVDVVLRNVSAEALAGQLSVRIAPMSLDGPAEDRGVIRDPLGWLLSQLPTITLCGICRTRTTTGSPSARGGRCDRCAQAAVVREVGARTCPGCGELGLVGEHGRCGRCDHRHALDDAVDQAAAAASARFPDDPSAPGRARAEVGRAAHAAAEDVARRGADQLLQDLAARLAAHEAAAAWSASGPGLDGPPAGDDQPCGPTRWTCANAKCSRQSTAAEPASHLCSTCERERRLLEIREARHLRLAVVESC